MNSKQHFLKGIKDGIPICLGYLSVSFAFGVFAVGYGLTILEAVLISLTNVTSAGQLAAVPIIASAGSLLELAATQFTINLRYLLMSISLSQKLDHHVKLRNKFLIGFAITDEIFAVSASQDGQVSKYYMYGLSVTPVLGWTFGTFLGALAGNILPEIIISALGIAIYGMFIAIVVPIAKKSRPVLICSGIAIIISCLFNYVPVLNKISGGFVIIIAAIIAAALCALLFPLSPSQDATVEGGDSE